MEQTENEFIKLWIEGGILYGKYKPHIVVDLQAARKVVQDRFSLVKGKDYPTVGYLDDLANVTKEARDYFSKDDGVKYMKKLALITGSPISRMLGNFWLQISKPTVPTRLFATEEEAVRWLKEE